MARAVEEAYAAGGNDYSMEPLHLVDRGAPVGLVRPGDSVIFCCRRGEREIELTDAFTDPAFSGFARAQIAPLDFVMLTMYHGCPSPSRRARWRTGCQRLYRGQTSSSCICLRARSLRM